MKYLIVVACFLAVAAAQAVIGPDGHPVETPEVQHAKAIHFAAKAAAVQGRSLDFSAYAAPYVAPYVAHSPYFYSAYYGYPTVTAGGVPLDTPEVAAEKAKHFAAHAEALSRSGRKRRDLYTATYHGVPVEAYGHAGYVSPYAYGFY